MNRRSVLGALAAAALYPVATFRALRAEGPPRALQLGERLEPLTLAGLNGPSRSLGEFRGKPLIINLWASWCEPCRAEMKSFDRLAWLPIGRQVHIVGVSTDDEPQQARDWLARSNATINQYIDVNQRLESLLGASTIPMTVLVAPDGAVLARVRGARQWDSEESLAMIRQVFALDPAGRRNAGGGEHP